MSSLFLVGYLEMEGKLEEELPKKLVDWTEVHVTQFFNSNKMLKKHAHHFTDYNGEILLVLTQSAFEASLGILDGNACFGLLAKYKQGIYVSELVLNL